MKEGRKLLHLGFVAGLSNGAVPRGQQQVLERALSLSLT
jgi:hypothetical protein